MKTSNLSNPTSPGGENQIFEQRLKSFYKYSDGYLRHLKEKDADFFIDYITLVSKYIVLNSMRIIDLGCGTGMSSRNLTKKNAMTVGTDISHLFLQDKSSSNLGSVRFVVSDAMTLPFRKHTFDIICSHEFIEHIPNVPQVLTEMIRVVKENGIIIIMSPNMYSPVVAFRNLFYLLNRNETVIPWVETRVAAVKWLSNSLFVLVRKKMNLKSTFNYRVPDLTDKAHSGGDHDSVYLSNAIDITKFLKQNGLKILEISHGRNVVGKIFSFVFPNFSSGVAIVAKRI